MTATDLIRTRDGAMFDVIVIGAGPAGLCLAIAAADAGLSVAVVERQPLASLVDPAPDGREIAMTHRARGILSMLGVWQRFTGDEVSPLVRAAVSDGRSPFVLGFEAAGSGREQLGFLVSNHVIRREAFAQARSRDAITIVTDTPVTSVATSVERGTVTLGDDTRLHARLVVAADNRFSENRRRMGIGAQMLDFGRVVIVCRVRHERPHQGIAHECFGYGGTLAVLPLNGNHASIVVTVPADVAPRLLSMTPEGYCDYARERFADRLGPMTLDGERHAYPLVAVYAHRFVATRFALVGDAAVGMHPVTAHGFNFGLYGIDALARGWQRERRRASFDAGSDSVLSAYQSEHRRVTLPIYTGTNAIVRLFTDDRPPARLVRTAALRMADLIGPIRHRIVRQLTETAPAA